MKSWKSFFQPDTTIFDSKNQSNRYYLLDLLRFLACIMVIFWHYQHFFYIQPGVRLPGFRFSHQPFYDCFKLFYVSGGYYGIHIFWALSGFVFFALFSTRIGEKQLSAKQFALDRFSRLYPLHLISLVTVALLTILLTHTLGHSGIFPHNDWYHFLLNLFFVPCILPNKGFSFNAPVWSVSLELLAYILFYLYARFLKAGLFKTLCIILFFAWVKPYPASFPFGQFVNLCCFFFFSGGGIYLLVRECSNYIHYVCVYLFFGIVFLLTAVWLKHPDVWTLFAVFLFSLPVALPKKVGSFFFALGNLTYSMYMLHITVQLSLFFIVNVVLKRKMYEAAKSPYFCLAYLLIVIVMSFLTYKYVELPIKQRLRSLLKPASRT